MPCRATRPGPAPWPPRPCPRAPAPPVAEPALEPVLVAALAGADLAAVPSRGAPADPLRLEEHHVEPGLGEVQRRRKPGVAAADHADVGAETRPSSAGNGGSSSALAAYQLSG